jgi:hypothetical protein
MANESNLKSWKPGQSGNPNGKPKGSKHLSTWIRELMEDESFEIQLIDGTITKNAPVKAIVNTLLHKAINGDLRAIDLIAKYGYGTKVDITSDYKQLPVPILNGISKNHP